MSVYNNLYQYIDNNLPIIKPISLALSGSTTFGSTGFVIGLSTGIIDELAIQYQLYQNRYLSSVFLGCQTGFFIDNSISSAIIGASIALSTIPTSFSKAFFILPLISGIFGHKALGPQWAIIGTLTPIIEATLIENDILDQKYLTYSFLSTVFLAYSLNSHNLLYTATGGLLLGMLIAENENYFIRSSLIESLYDAYSKIITPNELYKHFHSHIATLIAGENILLYLRTKILRYQQEIAYNFEHINEAPHNANQLNLAVKSFFMLVVPFFIGDLIHKVIGNYFAHKLYQDVNSKLKHKLFANETAMKISYEQNSSTLIDNLRGDTKILSYEGANLLSSLLSTSVEGTYGLGVITTYFPSLLIPLMIYNKFVTYCSHEILEQRNFNEANIKNQQSLILNVLKHGMSNIRTINEAKGVSYLHSQIIELEQQLQAYELQKDYAENAFKVWNDFSSITSFIANYFLIARKINIGELPFDKRLNIHFSSMKVSEFLSWNSSKIQELKQLENSVDRVNSFLNACQNNISANIGDNITRQLLKEQHNILKFSNLEISIDNRTLIKTGSIELEYGKRYAVLAPAGTGKSSLASKIIGIKETHINGKGSISFPQDSKIKLLSQQDYFPLYVSFAEIIFYPDAVRKKQLPKVKKLLTTLDFTQYDFAQKEDWNNVLSGGQKKKIKLISAIITKPDILILDETFSCLDKVSMNKSQELLKNSLNKSLIISIDHNVIEQSKSNPFYTDFLEIINGTLTKTQEICLDE